MSTYLLLWRPDNNGISEAQTWQQNLDKEHHWPGDIEGAEPGDIVFVLRLGVQPGIIARGTVCQPSLAYAYKSNAGITCKWEDVRPDCTQGLLSLLTLKCRFPTQQWESIDSAIKLTKVPLDELNDLWKKAKNRHSLITFFYLFGVMPERLAWIKTYREACERMQAIRDRGYFSGGELEDFWLPPVNGICSVAPGFLSNDNYTSVY